MDLLTELKAIVKTLRPAEAQAIIDGLPFVKPKKMKGIKPARKRHANYAGRCENLRKAREVRSQNKIVQQNRKNADLGAELARLSQDVELTRSEQHQVDRIVASRTQPTADDRLDAIESVIADRAVGAMVCHGGEVKTL